MRKDLSRSFVRWLVATVAVASMQVPAQAARHALVIGNSAYQSIGRLKNPSNDADLMEVALKGVGFEVSKHKDLSVGEMKKALREFRAKLKENDAAVVYFSGHGFQLNGENLLAPTDFNAKYDYEAAEAAINLNTIVRALGDAQAMPKLVFLDCCRDNPEFKSFTRSVSKGMAEVRTPDDETLVCFATKHGAVAEDNPDQPNSNYTKSLASEMVRPGRKIEDTMKAVTRTVRESSNGGQIPYTYGNLVNDFYFIAGDSGGEQSRPAASGAGDGNALVMQQMAKIQQQLERMQALQSERMQPSAQPLSTPPAPSPSFSVPDAVSSRPPAPPESSGGVPSSFTEFFREKWSHEGSNDPAAWAGDFAASVDYCYKTNGAASRSWIENDRYKLLQRYPQRSYSLVDTPALRTISPTEVQASYVYKYSYDGRKQASGRSRVSLTAELRGGRWQITRFYESVVRH